MRLVLLALSFVIGGCYQIDADISGLSASAGQQSFDGAGAAAGQSVAITRTLTFDAGSSLTSLLRAARIDAVTLAPESGVTSLEFLSSVTLTLQTDAGEVPLLDWHATSDTTSPDGTVHLSVEVDVDPALLAAPMHVAAAVRFLAPADAWSMRIDAALTVRGHADLKL